MIEELYYYDFEVGVFGGTFRETHRLTVMPTLSQEK